jgi:hypothetical protein
MRSGMRGKTLRRTLQGPSWLLFKSNRLSS